MIERIVILNDISEAKGGATALALESALRFRERGHAVTYITGDSGENAELANSGVAVVALGHRRLLSAGPTTSLLTGLYNSAARAMLGHWISENDTASTVYHLHGWAQILSPSIFLALDPVRDRLLLSAHDFFLACPNGSFSFLKTGAVCGYKPLSMSCITAQCDRRNYGHKLWRVSRQFLHRFAYKPRTSPPVLAIHETMRSFLMRSGIPDHAITTLPNPVRPYSQTRIPAEQNRRALFVGRLEATKGPDLAAEACRRAGIALCFVGDGVMRAELETRYPEFEFAGRMPPAEIAAYAARSRVLLMPSRYPEPYGLVAAEALWSGLPVIAAETAFLARDIVESEAGYSCDPRDHDAFAACLATAFADDDMWRTTSENAFARTRAIGLTPDRWIDRLLIHYQSRLDRALWTTG